jgi:hypothetical protein
VRKEREGEAERAVREHLGRKKVLGWRFVKKEEKGEERWAGGRLRAERRCGPRASEAGWRGGVWT